MCKPLVSLCIPTNGVCEWVFPVLESIYIQNVDENLFEVVLTDNGNNIEFKSKIKDYIGFHNNIIYIETKALPFINEIESYKNASGEFIKFVNHRTKMVDGALKKIIDYVEGNRCNKPITYFSNGVLNNVDEIVECYQFDEFVKHLSYWSSWSTGMAIWKSDFKRLPEDVGEFNELFPHTNVLFNERNREKYVIDNSVIFEEIEQGNKPKGNYDLYYAFGIEYPRIIENLLKDGDISKDTYKYVLDKNLEFIALLYCQYNIKKKYCSYDLSGLDNMLGQYYSRFGLNKKIIKFFFKKIIAKFIKG